MTSATPRPGLHDVAPYQAPQLDVPVRLNTNESPYPLPEAFRQALAEAVRELPLNRYPDRESLELRQALAAHVVHPVDGTWVANGSNEVIEQLLLAYAGPGRKVALFEPTYALHARLARVAHATLVRRTLAPPFTLTSNDVSGALEENPDVIFVCSPNNPTGNAQPPSVVEELASGSDALVVLDEAYIEFGGASAVGLVAGNPNVVVVRTFSKAFALAGARLGYCLAAPGVVDDLRRVRLPYHMSALTQAAGLVALRFAKEALSILEAIRAQRDRIFEALCRMPEIEAFRSDANFVLFRTPGRVERVWRGLLDRGVLVRDLSDVVPDALRVTAGTTEETDAFLSALEEALT